MQSNLKIKEKINLGPIPYYDLGVQIPAPNILKYKLGVFSNLVGLVISWGSSNYHSSFSPISNPCRGL